MQPRGFIPRFRDDISRRLYVELYCFYLIFRFHDHNNHLRKAVTIMVVFVWAVLEIGLAFELARVPEPLSWLRLFVGLLLARMWNIELNNFAQVVSNSKANRDDGRTRTRDDE